jgi:hypothetical protein
MISLRENTEKRLEEMEERSSKSLRFTMCRNHKYYYAKKKGDKKYYYLGKENEPEVQRIKQSHYLRQMLKDLGIEIRLLSELKAGHREISYVGINARLPYNQTWLHSTHGRHHFSGSLYPVCALFRNGH